MTWKQTLKLFVGIALVREAVKRKAIQAQQRVAKRRKQRVDDLNYYDSLPWWKKLYHGNPYDRLETDVYEFQLADLRRQVSHWVNVSKFYRLADEDQGRATVSLSFDDLEELDLLDRLDDRRAREQAKMNSVPV